MKRGINIAILGRGTVAQGVIKLLKRNRKLIEKKVGATLSLARVLARGTRKQKDIQLPARLLTDVPDDILKAMGAGKDMVTANKALLAVHGEDIFARAQKHGIDIGFEASVGG